MEKFLVYFFNAVGKGAAVLSVLAASCFIVLGIGHVLLYGIFATKWIWIGLLSIIGLYVIGTFVGDERLETWDKRYGE